MKLFIVDRGDSSVGCFPQEWTIEVPFNREDVEPIIVEEFKEDMQKIYSNYCDGKCVTYYDFELAEFVDDNEF